MEFRRYRRRVEASVRGLVHNDIGVSKQSEKCLMEELWQVVGRETFGHLAVDGGSSSADLLLLIRHRRM